MSTNSEDAGRARPAREWVTALRSLHVQRGMPSSRRIAQLIGDVSHTTIAQAISGRRLPSWAIFERIVVALDGDVAHFHRLWLAAHDEAAHSPRESDVDAEFLARYRQKVTDYYGALDAPVYGPRQRVPLLRLYVPHRIDSESPKSGVIQLTDFDGRLDRAVLLGNPGVGKTALCQVLMYQHAGNEDLPVPFLVSLRSVSAGPLVALIERQVETVLQFVPPAGVVARLLDRGAAVVMFDGLDEVLDVVVRGQVASAIEMFAREFPEARILVTSRPAGYLETRLHPGDFPVYEIRDLSDPQVRLYVERWFSNTRTIASERELAELVDGFMRETGGIADLRSVPLLLSQIVTAYSGEGSIERGRPEIYEKSFELMAVDWELDESVRYLAVPVLRWIAYWLLTDENSRRVPTLPDLTRVATEYLQRHRGADPDQAEAVATVLMKAYTGRARTLSETGVTSYGEPAYAFSHRTVMEYLAASHLVRQHDTPEQVARTLSGLLAEDEWVAIGKLAVLLEDRLVDRGAERLVASLLDEIEGLSGEHRAAAENLLARSVELVSLPAHLRNRILPPTTAEREQPAEAGDKVGYRGPAACQLSGVTYRQLDYWARTGLVAPSMRTVAGTGTSRLYSIEDVVILKVIKRLLDTGVSLQNIRVAADHMRHLDIDDLARITLFSDGENIYETSSPEEVDDLLQGGQGVFGIAVSGAVREVTAAAEDMPDDSGTQSVELELEGRRRARSDTDAARRARLESRWS